jgi:hypothetical protein
MRKVNDPMQRRRRETVKNDLGEVLPIGVQKSYFMLSDAERGALEKYRPAIALRNQYAIRLYAWAKKHASVASKRITLDQLRTVLGLDSVKDADGTIIRKRV